MKPRSIGYALVVVTALAVAGGCTKSVDCGDATIKMKENLFKTMIYWLESPSFTIGTTNDTAVFKYRSLPYAAIPETVIVERTQFTNDSDKGNPTPSYLPTKLEVVCTDTNGVPFLRAVVDFSTLPKGAVWPHAVNIVGERSGTTTTDYDVRIRVLTPSTRRADRAYLYTGLSFPDGIPKPK
jgi:hypothetical protein